MKMREGCSRSQLAGYGATRCGNWLRTKRPELKALPFNSQLNSSSLAGNQAAGMQWLKPTWRPPRVQHGGDQPACQGYGAMAS